MVQGGARHHQRQVGIKECLDRDDDLFEYNFTHEILKKHPDVTEQIEQHLESRGFRKLEYFNHGGYGIMFSTPHHQLVRVCVDFHEHPPVEPEIIQPLPDESRKFLVPGEKFHGKPVSIDVAVYPEVRVAPTEVTIEHILQLGQSLINKGYEIHDPQRRNFGFLPNGDPIIIDVGAVRPTRNRKWSDFVKKVARLFTGATEQAVSTESFPQNQFYPRTAQGVASDETLARIEAEHTDGCVYADVIRSEGMYARNLMDRLGRAAEKANQTGEPLSNFIRSDPSSHRR